MFRQVIAGAKRVIEFGQKMFTSISGVFQKLFGDQVQSWEEAWNLLTFKLAVGAEFLGIIAEKLFSFFGQIVERYGPGLVNMISDIVKICGSFGYKALASIPGSCYSHW